MYLDQSSPKRQSKYLDRIFGLGL